MGHLWWRASPIFPVCSLVCAGVKQRKPKQRRGQMRLGRNSDEFARFYFRFCLEVA
jgi:hypothetical protein